MRIEFSKHSIEQMTLRNIVYDAIMSVIQQPDQILKQDQVISIFTKLIYENGKAYIYRVFVNVAKEPNVVITVYKSSKIEKYGYPI